MIDLLSSPEVRVFLCGIFGSAIVEALIILRYYQKPGPFPQRYKKIGFWVIRSIIAIGAGVLATIYDPASLLLATHIGASAPLIITAMAETVPADQDKAA